MANESVYVGISLLRKKSNVIPVVTGFPGGGVNSICFKILLWVSDEKMNKSSLDCGSITIVNGMLIPKKPDQAMATGELFGWFALVSYRNPL